jgi:GT2 family glycosyltransferase
MSSGIAVVICAYTECRWELLLAAIASVKGQTLPADEVVVVVDNNPRLLERLRASVSEAEIVENPGPAGLSGARNAGVAATTAPIVAFLDDDAVAAPTWVERLSAVFATDKSIVGVGGAVTPCWLGTPPRWLPEEFHWTVGCSYRGLPTDPRPVRNVIGANMAFRRWAIDAAGGFNPEIGQVGSSMQRGDDTEFCIRLTRRLPGTTIVYDPSVHVRHAVPPERTTLRYFIHRCYTEGIAKARIARLVGSNQALAAERRQVFSVLPRGVIRELGTRSIDGVQRAAVMVFGLALTGIGYLQGVVEHLG